MPEVDSEKKHGAMSNAELITALFTDQDILGVAMLGELEFAHKRLAAMKLTMLLVNGEHDSAELSEFAFQWITCESARLIQRDETIVDVGQTLVETEGLLKEMINKWIDSTTTQGATQEQQAEHANLLAKLQGARLFLLQLSQSRVIYQQFHKNLFSEHGRYAILRSQVNPALQAMDEARGNVYDNITVIKRGKRKRSAQNASRLVETLLSSMDSELERIMREFAHSLSDQLHYLHLQLLGGPRARLASSMKK